MPQKSWRKQLLAYFVKTLNGMALGLFSTLIIGVIVRQIGTWTASTLLLDLAAALISLMGVGIGLGVANSLDQKGLKLIAGAVAGGIATRLAPPDPMVAYLTTIAAIEAMRFVLRKTTPVDILIVPLFSGAVAGLTVFLIGSPVASFMQALGTFIQNATAYQPFFMGIVIAVAMGMILTAPISSAAIAIAIGLSGIAGGAAVVGGAVQMIGFAVMSRKDNDFGTVLSVAFGTSMLQFKNILKKPILWIPTIVVSAILGPISTLVFRIQTDASGAGMGTSGLVGQFATVSAMGSSLTTWGIIVLLHFVLPALLVWAIDLFFRKKGWIQIGDLALKEIPVTKA